MNKAKIPLDLARVRELLEGARGRDYRRSLEEIAGTEEFEELLHREFPRQASEWPEGNGRRFPKADGGFPQSRRARRLHAPT